MAERELDVITKAIDRFSKHLHTKLTKQDINDLFSSVSIHGFLTLLSQDPWFYNKDIFNGALCLNVNDTSTHYKDVFEAFSHVNDLLIANTCFLKPRQVVEAFKNRLRDNYASEVNSLDFAKPEHATATINAWVRDKTTAKVTPLSELNDDVNCTFLNATHFKSNWAEPFSADETVPTTFYLNERDTVQVQMMRKRGEFYFKECKEMNSKILKLPFANNKVSLVIALPNQGSNVNEIINQFFYDSKDLTSNIAKEMLDVSLPKFKIEEALELAQYLKKLNLEEVFSADLCGVIDDEDLACDEIQQKVYLEVNEEGSEVAAGTVATLTKAHFEKLPPENGLNVYEANISSEVSNRFAKTKVVWKVKNTNNNAADANFKVILTDTAFITEFVMEIEGKSYKSSIKEKKEASSIFKKAVKRGQSAGLVEAKTRDSTEFTVSVNLEPDSVAVFSLIYEEMLQRVHDQYELVLNICPGQIVDNLNIEVCINESQPLRYVKTPPLRSGIDMNKSEFVQILDPLSDIKMINPKTASVKFHPNSARQRKLTHYLGNKTSDGLSGQFVVQYDVEREPLDGEVLFQDGYFVHFFAPNDLDSLPKHIVFVLDTSGSMEGRRIEQLKDAMMNILGDLRIGDMLSIIEFNDNVIVWDIDSKKSVTVPAEVIKDFKKPFAYLKECVLADPLIVSDGIIKKAKEVVQDITAKGLTFMIGGLEMALYLVKMGRQINEDKSQKPQPIIVFLTDGQPNVGIYSTDEIVELVTRLNVNDKVPIFSLCFGDEADKYFLRKLSLKNVGFSKHIYEATDASLQLQDFYQQISSPLLHDVRFKYDDKVGDVTKTWFPIYFRGSELVVAGRCEEEIFPTTIDCCGICGPITIKSSTKKPVTSLERLWAYLTVKQLLDERDISANPKQLTKRAVKLALKYSFVTDVTSLVVVKPKEKTSAAVSRAVKYGGKTFLNRLRHMNSKPVLYSYGSRRRCSAIMPCSGFPRRCAFSCKLPPGLSETLAELSESIYRDKESNSEEKRVEKFTADRPFLVFLQMEVGDDVLTLFQGCIYKPNY